MHAIPMSSTLLASHAQPSIAPSVGMLLNVEPIMPWLYLCITFPCHVHRTQVNKGRCFYYWQVSGKPPAAPSGLHDCEDVHVGVRLIRLLTAEREDLLPLPNLLE